MDQVINFWNKTNRWHRLGFLFLILELKFHPMRQYGFTCNDPALSHPFYGDTIDMRWLSSAVLLFPILMLLLTERVQCGDSDGRWRRQALRWYKEYLFGVLLNLSSVAVIKCIMGMPRPHFFDTCAPVEAETCDGDAFVERYTCSKAGWVTQSDRSFPSGHAALAVHAGLFLAVYLHCRFSGSGHRSKARYGQAALLALAGLCALSRVWDRRHHWWDVLAGCVLALPILWYTISCLCKNFDLNTPSTSAKRNSMRKPKIVNN